MRIQFNLCRVVALCGIAACHSIPEKTLDTQSKFTDCIGRGSFRSDTLERCNLSLWTKVPVLIKESRKLVLQIPKGGAKYTIPCSPNTSWVGHLSQFLILKCVNRRVRLYWVETQVETQFGVIAMLYANNDRAIEYAVSNDYDHIWPNELSRELGFLVRLEQDRPRAEALLK